MRGFNNWEFLCASIVLTACSTVADATGTDGASAGESSLTAQQSSDASNEGSGGTDDSPSASGTGTGSGTLPTSGGTEEFATTTSPAGVETQGTTFGSEGGDTGIGTTGDPDIDTDSACVPVPETCNQLDDDCNDIIDDLDVGGDGICDCLSIALVGDPGSNDSSEFQAWLQAQGTSVARIGDGQNPGLVLDQAELAKYDIVILDLLQRSYTAEEASAVRTWVEGGSGLMALTGHTGGVGDSANPNSILAGMGLQYNSSQGFFDGPITSFAAHPITAGLTSISFYGGLYVDAVDDGVGKNQTIMTLAQGPVGVVQEREDGRIFVFGDEWVEFDSEWQNMPEIKQFWVQTLAYLGPKDSCTVPQ